VRVQKNTIKERIRTSEFVYLVRHGYKSSALTKHGHRAARERNLSPSTFTIFGTKAGGVALAKLIEESQSCVRPWEPRRIGSRPSPQSHHTTHTYSHQTRRFNHPPPQADVLRTLERVFVPCQHIAPSKCRFKKKERDTVQGQSYYISLATITSIYAFPSASESISSA
jgi:hypothetical protein